jgi:nicotinate-nucleotide adenylyltransferase
VKQNIYENRIVFRNFNPIHGHLIIANHMAENSDLDQVWLVVTPHNLEEKVPCLMTTIGCKWYLATEDFPKLQPSDIEFQINGKHTSSPERNSDHEFSLIMGEDNLNPV